MQIFFSSESSRSSDRDGYGRLEACDDPECNDVNGNAVHRDDNGNKLTQDIELTSIASSTEYDGYIHNSGDEDDQTDNEDEGKTCTNFWNSAYSL